MEKENFMPTLGTKNYFSLLFIYKFYISIVLKVGEGGIEPWFFPYRRLSNATEVQGSWLIRAIIMDQMP